MKIENWTNEFEPLLDYPSKKAAWTKLGALLYFSTFFIPNQYFSKDFKTTRVPLYVFCSIRAAPTWLFLACWELRLYLTNIKSPSPQNFLSSEHHDAFSAKFNSFCSVFYNIFRPYVTWKENHPSTQTVRFFKVYLPILRAMPIFWLWNFFV